MLSVRVASGVRQYQLFTLNYRQKRSKLLMVRINNSESLLTRLKESRDDTMGVEGLDANMAEAPTLFTESQLQERMSGEPAFPRDERGALLNLSDGTFYTRANELAQRIDAPPTISTSTAANETREIKAAFKCSQFCKHALSGEARGRVEAMAEGWDPTKVEENRFQRLYQTLISSQNLAITVLDDLCNRRFNELGRTDSWLSTVVERDEKLAEEVEQWNERAERVNREIFDKVSELHGLDKKKDPPRAESFLKEEKAARLLYEQRINAYVREKAPAIVRISKLTQADLNQDEIILMNFRLEEWEQKWTEKYGDQFLEKELSSNVSSFKRRHVKSLVLKLKEEELRKLKEQGDEYKLISLPCF
jgi:hypothetical protein